MSSNYSTIRFSIVICTLSNYEGLRKCIESICKQTLHPYEVIIVHGDKGGSFSDIMNQLKSVKIEYKYVNTIRSLIIQRNMGIDHSEGEVVVYLDDDVILENDYFFNLMEVYQEKWDQHLGGVQGTIIEDTPKRAWHLTEIFKKIFLLNNHTGKGRLLRSARPGFCGSPIKIQTVNIFSGCLMSFRKEVLLKNRFDENFVEFWAYDDIELSYRISKQYILYQTPFAKLHHISSSGISIGYRNVIKMMTVNRLYVFKKYLSKSTLNWCLFFWSNIGELLFVCMLCFKLKSILPIKGFWEGWKLIIRNQVSYLKNQS